MKWLNEKWTVNKLGNLFLFTDRLKPERKFDSNARSFKDKTLRSEVISNTKQHSLSKVCSQHISPAQSGKTKNVFFCLHITV